MNAPPNQEEPKDVSSEMEKSRAAPRTRQRSAPVLAYAFLVLISVGMIVSYWLTQKRVEVAAAPDGTELAAPVRSDLDTERQDLTAAERLLGNGKPIDSLAIIDAMKQPDPAGDARRNELRARAQSLAISQVLVEVGDYLEAEECSFAGATIEAAPKFVQENSDVAAILAAVEPKPPELQLQFCAIMREGQRAAAQAENDFQRVEARQARRMKLKRLFAKMDRRDRISEAYRKVDIAKWWGSVALLDTTGRGGGIVSVKLEGCDATVGTVNTEVFDLDSKTLVRSGTWLWMPVSHLRLRQMVVFSGSILIDVGMLDSQLDADWLRETSVTLDGSLAQPSFLFRFSQLDGARLPSGPVDCGRVVHDLASKLPALHVRLGDAATAVEDSAVAKWQGRWTSSVCVSGSDVLELTKKIWYTPFEMDCALQGGPVLENGVYTAKLKCSTEAGWQRYSWQLAVAGESLTLLTEGYTPRRYFLCGSKTWLRVAALRKQIAEPAVVQRLETFATARIRAELKNDGADCELYARQVEEFARRYRHTIASIHSSESAAQASAQVGSDSLRGGLRRILAREYPAIIEECKENASLTSALEML